jgi:hypothetical protein
MIKTQICTTLLCDVCGNEIEDVGEGHTPHAPSTGEAADIARLLDWTVSEDGLSAICDADDDAHKDARRSAEQQPPTPMPMPGQTLLPKELLAPENKPDQPEPPTVTLCGSTKFWAEFAEVNLRETAEGRMVLAPGCDLKQSHPAWGDPETAEALKTRLDALHFAKIRAAHLVVVVSDATGYIGQSTHREIAYALRRGLPVRHDKVDLATGTVTSSVIWKKG